MMTDDVLDHQGDEALYNPPQVEYAGFGVRLAAMVVDILVFLPLVVLNIYNFVNLKILFLALIISIASLVYKPYMESTYGATLGKMAMKLRVVKTNFTALDIEDALIRSSPWIVAYIMTMVATVFIFNEPGFNKVHGIIAYDEFINKIPIHNISELFYYLVLLSCVVVAFTDKKQGFHDMIAKTYCIYR